MLQVPVTQEQLEALVGGLLGAVDHLMYLAHQPAALEVVAAEGGDPRSEEVIRAIAEIAVHQTNSHVAGPAAEFTEATTNERVEMLTRYMRALDDCGPPRPFLKLVR